MNSFVQFFTTHPILRQVNSEAKTTAGKTIDINRLCFAWRNSAAPVLNIDNLRVERGQRMFIVGRSGSGKSTLLGLLAGIVTPQAGQITVLGRFLDAMSGTARDRFRADHMGVIFQMFNLIAYLSVVENVTLPCRFSHLRREKTVRSAGSVEAEARRLLTHLDLGHTDLLSRPVTELSVGQQQRVAAARALMGAPEIIIADEPTSSLDAAHRKDFIELLFEECRREDTALVFVSHDTSLAPMFDLTVHLTEINRVISSADGQRRTS